MALAYGRHIIHYLITNQRPDVQNSWKGLGPCPHTRRHGQGLCHSPRLLRLCPEGSMSGLINILHFYCYRFCKAFSDVGTLNIISDKLFVTPHYCTQLVRIPGVLCQPPSLCGPLFQMEQEAPAWSHHRLQLGCRFSVSRASLSRIL